MNIRGRALQLGFDKAGIAPVGSLPRSEFYRRWVAEGMHGEMGYMEREGPRLDAELLLPGARSVVCVLKNYYRGVPRTRDALRGAISRYAWGEDYHRVLGEKLRLLGEFVEHETGAKTKICVDTSAVLEKLWARQAGLGWQGKHTNLLSRDFSSWFFLGEILVAAALEPDRPHEKDYCGRCTRCIDVCPTRAIVAPYVLDARRCISYLTIEHRGPIPRELRSSMGNLIFGCDLCLEACPWNKFAREARESEFGPRDGLAAPALGELMELTEEGFRKRFRGSAVLRARRSGFLRNVAVALGNSGSPEAVAPLARGLRDADPLVRSHAAWGLGRLGTPEARRELKRAAEEEADCEVREEIAAALAESASPSPAGGR